MTVVFRIYFVFAYTFVVLGLSSFRCHAQNNTENKDAKDLSFSKSADLFADTVVSYSSRVAVHQCAELLSPYLMVSKAAIDAVNDKSRSTTNGAGFSVFEKVALPNIRDPGSNVLGNFAGQEIQFNGTSPSLDFISEKNSSCDVKRFFYHKKEGQEVDSTNIKTGLARALIDLEMKQRPKSKLAFIGTHAGSQSKNIDESNSYLRERAKHFYLNFFNTSVDSQRCSQLNRYMSAQIQTIYEMGNDHTCGPAIAERMQALNEATQYFVDEKVWKKYLAAVQSYDECRNERRKKQKTAEAGREKRHKLNAQDNSQESFEGGHGTIVGRIALARYIRVHSGDKGETKDNAVRAVTEEIVKETERGCGVTALESRNLTTKNQADRKDQKKADTGQEI